MKLYKFRSLTICIFYLIAALWSELLCMEPAEDKLQLNKMQLISKEEINQPPYNAVVSLESYFHSGAKKAGTGFLIGGGFILTAAHVVFDLESSEDATKILCYFNRHGGGVEVPDTVKKYAYPKLYPVYSDLYKKYHDISLLNASVFKLLRKERDITIGQYDTTRIQNLNSTIISGHADIQSALHSMVGHDYALLDLSQGNSNIKPIVPKAVPGYNQPCWFCGYPAEDYTNKNKHHQSNTTPYQVRLPTPTTPSGNVLCFTTPDYDKITPLYGGMSGGPIVILPEQACDITGIQSVQACAIIASSIRTKKLVFGCGFTEKILGNIESCKQLLKEEGEACVDFTVVKTIVVEKKEQIIKTGTLREKASLDIQESGFEEPSSEDEDTCSLQ